MHVTTEPGEQQNRGSVFSEGDGPWSCFVSYFLKKPVVLSCAKHSIHRTCPSQKDIAMEARGKTKTQLKTSLRSCVWGACVRACAHIWPILCVCVSLSACSQSRPRETEIEREKERKRQGSKEKESLERTGMNHKADILVICVA